MYRLDSVIICSAIAVCVGHVTPAVAAIESQGQPSQNDPKPLPAPVLTKAPELLRLVNATYPQELLVAGIDGMVLLYIDIDATGEVARATVVNASHDDFRVPALVAASGFIFSPAQIDDVPSGIRIEYRYVFRAPLPIPDVIAGAPAIKPSAKLPLNYYGEVLLAGMRRPISGAQIVIDGRPVAETDIQGHFEIRGVPIGKHRVKVRGPFHDTYITDEVFTPGEALKVRYFLRQTSSNPFETVVRGKVKRREAAKVTLGRSEVSKIAGTGGDPIRVIENLPGMSRAPGGAGGALLVRGANPTDSRVFIDGIEVPLIYHFGGLTSVVNPNMLEEVEFYPGGFGARYGSTIAGVVQVKTRRINCEGWHGNVDINLLHAGLYTCLKVGRWTFAAAGRRSYIDAILPTVLKAIPREEDEGTFTLAPVYADYQLKGQARYGAHSLDILFFGADDRFKVIQEGSAEGINFEISLKLAFHRILLKDTWRITDKLMLRSIVSPGYVRNQFVGQSEELDVKNEFKLVIWGVQWREELEYEPTQWLSIRGGIDMAFGGANLVIDAPIPTDIAAFPTPTFDFGDTRRFTRKIPNTSHAYWAEATLETGFGLQITPGFRLDRWDFHHTQDYSFQPRVNARFEVLKGSVIKAAYGLYEKLPEPPFLMERPLGNPALEPLRSQHFIVGFEHAFTDVINIDVQLFYNLRRNIPSPSNSVIYRDGKQLAEVWSNDGGGETYGCEILLRHLASNKPEDRVYHSLVDYLRGRFYGWIAYTLSRSLRFDHAPDATYSLQQGQGAAFTYRYNDRASKRYLAEFDQTHILTIVAQLILPMGFEAGARFRLVSGNPFTPLQRGDAYFDADSASYHVDLTNVPRNSRRMPMFHQLDIRIDKTWTFDLWSFAVYVEVLNVYNRKNVEQFQYDYRFQNKAPMTFLPFFPVLGVKGTW